MVIRNNTKQVYNIAGKFLMPNQAVAIDDKVKENPVVASLIKAKKLSIENGNTKTISDANEAKTAFEALLETNPSLIKLRNFAKKNGISLNDAKTEEDIIAVIKASITLAGL